MSAVEALAEVLRQHHVFIGSHIPADFECSGCDGRFNSWDTAVGHQSTAVVAAIRSMPAEQVAELIDGVTEDHGSNVDPHTRLPLNVTHRRAIGPWLPLGVSPETNGEQK